MRWPWQKREPSIAETMRCCNAAEHAIMMAEYGAIEYAVVLLREARSVPGAVWPGILDYAQHRIDEARNLQ